MWKHVGANAITVSNVTNVSEGLNSVETFLYFVPNYSLVLVSEGLNSVET